MSYTTDWQYDTSQDKSYSVLLASGGSGTLYLKDTTSNRGMSISYWYFGLGQSKGEDLGVSESTTNLYSSGDAVVSFTGDFWEGNFPCKGFLLTAGASLDLFNNAGGAVSQAFCEYLFGIPVFAGVRCHGKYLAWAPGVGISCALVKYGPATVYSLGV
jgi:hypothetical protein